MPNKYIYTNVPSNSDYNTYNAAVNTGIADRPYIQTGVDEFIRDTECVLSPIDITCISPAYRDNGGTWRSMLRWTLLTPNILVGATHWNPWKSTYPAIGDSLPYGVVYDTEKTNQEVLFVNQNNENVVERVLGMTKVAGDLCIAMLENPITEASGILPALAFPQDTPFKDPINGFKNPQTRLFGFDQQQHIAVWSCDFDYFYIGRFWAMEIKQRQTEPTNEPYFQEYYDEAGDNRGFGTVKGAGIEGRDSGSPFGMVFNGRFVLIGTLNGTGGTSYGITYYLKLLNATIKNLSDYFGKPVHYVETINLDGVFKRVFRRYPPPLP